MAPVQSKNLGIDSSELSSKQEAAGQSTPPQMKSVLQGGSYAEGSQLLKPGAGSLSPGQTASQGLGGGGEVPHRGAMEASFGRSFAGVRAHTGAQAQSACDQLGAQAYAQGQDIAFRAPNPSPALVAHELTHTL